MDEWISVEERLPENDDNVLIWHRFCTYEGNEYKEDYDIARYDQHFKMWLGQNIDEGSQVLYWMPLPKPPKEKRDGQTKEN